MLRQSVTRNSLLLGLFALCTTMVIVSTKLVTEDDIAEQRRMAEEKALLEVVPRHRHDNSMLDDTRPIGPEAGELYLREQKQIYIARRDNDVVAVIIPVVAPDGYTGAIDMIVGVNRDGSVAGVRVLSHRETPGLGDKVELRKSDWVLDFEGHTLSDPRPDGWAVKKDGGVFDQFTGATITPRAVVAAVERALQFARENRAQLFELPQRKPAQGKS